MNLSQSKDGEIFIVNSNADWADVADDGYCLDAFGLCTLRAAIQQANLSPGQQLIHFAIPVYPLDAVPTITPFSALPIITGPVVIDATTQVAGRVELDGSSAGAVHGLNITAGDSTVRGMVVNRFGRNGIVLRVNGGNVIEKNLIGTDVTGTLDRGNGWRGMWVYSSSDNWIGGVDAEDGNIIAFNHGDGIAVVNSVENAITSNSIHSNSSIGIDLDNDGVTANDPGDADRGANMRQNYPVITEVVAQGSGFICRGTLSTTPYTAGISYLVQLFSAASCWPEGFELLGETEITVDAYGFGSFEIVVPVTPSKTGFVTATATELYEHDPNADANGNTSEFSACFSLPWAP